MKILVLPSWYPPNGGGFFANQTSWLREKGIDSVVISVEDRSIKQFRPGDIKYVFRPRYEEFLGIPTYRKIQYRLPLVIRPNIRRWIRLTTSLCTSFITNYGKPDLIQVHSCMWAGVVAARVSSYVSSNVVPLTSAV